MVSIEKIVEIIKGSGLRLDLSNFDPDKTFKEQGIDSLDVFTILLAVEEQLGVKFSEEESDSILSAADIVKILRSQ